MTVYEVCNQKFEDINLQYFDPHLFKSLVKGKLYEISRREDQRLKKLDKILLIYNSNSRLFALENR